MGVVSVVKGCGLRVVRGCYPIVIKGLVHVLIYFKHFFVENGVAFGEKEIYKLHKKGENKQF